MQEEDFFYLDKIAYITLFFKVIYAITILIHILLVITIIIIFLFTLVEQLERLFDYLENSINNTSFLINDANQVIDSTSQLINKTAENTKVITSTVKDTAVTSETGLPDVVPEGTLGNSQALPNQSGGKLLNLSYINQSNTFTSYERETSPKSMLQGSGYDIGDIEGDDPHW